MATIDLLPQSLRALKKSTQTDINRNREFNNRYTKKKKKSIHFWFTRENYSAQSAEMGKWSNLNIDGTSWLLDHVKILPQVVNLVNPLIRDKFIEIPHGQSGSAPCKPSTRKSYYIKISPDTPWKLPTIVNASQLPHNIACFWSKLGPYTP